MKDKAMMMFDHICRAADVDQWAVEELRKVLAAYLADGCAGCAYEGVLAWELPCKKCKRNSTDYWRRGDSSDRDKRSTGKESSLCRLRSEA